MIPSAVTYENSFLYTYEKTILPIFTKINNVRPTVTCNMHTKFELNRMHLLDAIMFTLIHIYTHTHAHIHHRKNLINELRRPEKGINLSKSQSLIFSRLQYFPCIVYARKVKTEGGDIFWLPCIGKNLFLMPAYKVLYTYNKKIHYFLTFTVFISADLRIQW